MRTPRASLRTHLIALTPRQQTVLDCMGEGWTREEIAEELGISKRTLERHSTVIYDKLGVRTRMEAVIKGGVLNRVPTLRLVASYLHGTLQREIEGH